MNDKTISKMTKTLIPMLLLAVVFTVGISAVSAATGDTMYVNGTGGADTNDGLTWETAKKTIINATELVNENGIVNIANGQYTGASNTGITISKNMTINGESQTGTIINGTGSDRIFLIDTGINVTINNLTLTNGNQMYGGALYNRGTMTVTDCIFTNNTATYYGGVIWNRGTMIVTDCIFTNNTAINDYGGVIWNWGNMAVTDSIFTNNTAQDAGGAIYNFADLTVTDSTFTGNDGSSGGAIYSYNGNLTVTGSNFINNAAIYSGGAICNIYGTLTANFNRIYGNTAPSGSAIYQESGTSDIENNWWGYNSPVFANLLSGVTNPTHWLYMTINATPTTINNGETSLITVSFNNLFDGTTVTPLDPATGHIPDGTPVTFTTDLGSIGCKTIDKETSGGIATATLTADETPGIAHINATADSQTVNVNVTINGQSSQSRLYLTVTPSKTNPVVGDTVIYTLKVGNTGPDTATDVVMTYVVPEGLEFAGANVDVGTYTYDPVTRTITWTIGDVPVGDPYMWLSLKVMTAGSYLFNPQLSTSTYDPTLNTDTQSITIHTAAATNNNTAHAASTVAMQHTGVPIIALILALFMVIGGMVSSKK